MVGACDIPAPGFPHTNPGFSYTKPLLLSDVTASEQIPRRPRRISDILTGPGEVDMVSTPDPVSNLRSERDWRLLCERVDKFNSDFWTENNTKFITEKIAFEEDARSRGETVTPELLSVFYKDFLDRAYSRQTAYNRRWWRENLAMLYPGFKASVRNMRRAMMRARGGGSAGLVQAQAKGIKFWEKNVEI
ncbi:hypothetical protein BC937DRAFT_86143 [Endogone sp. FLAS-F59071]|nr:hypothetical protein BC937DRAFT_86143 [Endogone sp. FLAS-F59071]|eukprot:RUS23458.1 hypothetical protein BC937DRAFT_86143 [Endogone sp. FLAS-F59071]